MAQYYKISMKITESRALLLALAREGRRVLADWRAFVILRRATDSMRPGDRRWTAPPPNVQHVRPLLRKMVAARDLEPIPDLRHVYAVTAPFAQSDLVEEEQILMEAHPYAALAYLSALAFHGLTQQVPRQLQTMIPRKPPADVLPLGTTAEDWWDIERPAGQTPAHMRGRAIEWIAVQPRQYFGILEYRLHGHPVWVTAPEKTLLDGLHNPDRCGGIGDVLSAWREARDTLSVDAVIEYVDRLDISLLRQRVGFILDELALGNEVTDEWAKTAKRGGSSKLVSSEPYAPVFSEKWNLSLNAPLAALVG